MVIPADFCQHSQNRIANMGKFLSDFKEFALKGNVIDLAVGVIVGGAFGKIVSSLVNDIIMPIVSIATGGADFKTLKYVITPGTPGSADGTIEAVEEVAINYGMFIQNVVDFFIIALSIFFAIRIAMKLKKKEAEAPAEAPAPDPQIELLTEIRDLLKSEQNPKQD